MPIHKYQNSLLLLSQIVLSVTIAFWGNRFEAFTVVFLLLLSILPFLLVQNRENKSENFFTTSVFWTGLLCRIAFFFTLPKLSDDYFRFIWDGNLWNMGISAYQYLPSEFAESSQLFSDNLARLYPHLNSPTYYSVYPPLYQLFFQISSFFFGSSIWGNLLFMRSVLLLIELFALFLLLKLAFISNKNLNAKISLYWLNGLIIVESVGNIHIECVIGLLLLLCLYFFKNKREGYYLGLFFSLGFLLKLQPIIYALIFFLRKNIKQWIYAGISCLIIGFLFFFIYDFTLLYHAISKSSTLFIKNFEFNASIYFLLSKIGQWWTNHNPIQTVGPNLALFNSILILIYSIYHWKKKKPLSDGIIIILSIYLFCSTTVHPWYIIPMLMIVPLSRFRYPYIWGITIFLSYWGYFENAPYQHPYFLIFIEYLFVFGTILYDFKKKNTYLS